MPLDLTGKTAWVGGGSQGIGLAAAQHLAALGAKVILVARDAQRLEQALATLPGNGHQAVTVDYAHPEEVARKAAECAAQGPVHILVNNTGGPAGGAVAAADVQAFRNTFEQHLVCNHLLAQAFLPGMREAGYGRIINVISTSVKQPLHGLGVSNTIRGAVANWAKSLANEVGPEGITVNNVLPGATATSRLQEIVQAKSQQSGRPADQHLADMAAAVPMKRVAQPEEVARAIAFLASPAASYIHGINLPVDGGRTGCL
jgi:3-oxoacyl-[acyl-carrier protein] reductase